MISVVAALERRVRLDGARPLVTWYGDNGARIELSGTTFANWVDKTVNLLASLGAEDAPRVAMPLLLDHPDHWVSLVWVMATWQLGGEVLAAHRKDAEGDVAVVGPEQPHPVAGVETVACSLHPLGLGFAAPLMGVTDYAEVLSQPDVHWGSPSPLDRVCFCDTAADLTGTGLLATVTPTSQRVLVQASSPRQTVRDALVAPLLGGGSAVLVHNGLDGAVLESITAQELVS